MTIRQWSYLDGTLLASGQTAGSITPARVQDFVDTVNIRTTVSVLEYNPSAGDGSTDGTAAFTSAIAAGYKTVYVPDGTYIVTGITMNNAGQCLWISPGATIKLKAAGTNAVITISANNVIVTGGGTIDGNRANATAGSAYGVYVNGVTNATIQNLIIQHTINEAIRGSNCSNLSVLDNYITDTATSAIFVEITTTSGTLADCEFSRNFIDRSAESASTITTSGLQVHATGTSSIQQGTKVIANTILLPSNPTSNATLCIEIFEENHGTVIANNVIRGGGFGISLDTGYRASITGNTCFGCKNIGIEFAGCTRSTMAGNAVDGNAIGQTLYNINDNNGSGINDYNTITGNTGENGATANDKAVLVFNANGCTFSGNSFKHASSTNQVVYCNGGNNISISGGIIDGGSACSTGIIFDACTNATVTGVFFQNITNHPVLCFSDGATVDNIMVSGCTCVNTGVIIGTTGATGVLGNNISAMNCHGSGTFGKSSATSNGNVRWGSCLDIVNDVWDFVGSGSPNSSVTASPGSIYRNQAGGTTTTLYVKESGAATNTGWVAK